MKTNEMNMKGFGVETVVNFLQFIYVSEDPRTVHFSSDQRVFSVIKEFNRNKLTTELLRLAHMWEVKSLQMACVSNLKRNLSFGNAVDIWKTADELNIQELKLSATYSNLMCRKKTG